MHPIPQQLLQRTVAVTSRLGALFGALIHIGDPSVIGIKDIHRPDYGDPSHMDGCVPVFWASSLTSHLAIKSAGEFILFIFVQSRRREPRNEAISSPSGRIRSLSCPNL